MKGLKTPTNVLFSEGKCLKVLQKKSFERVATHFQISQHCKKID
jgi:hypothetical protein